MIGLASIADMKDSDDMDTQILHVERVSDVATLTVDSETNTDDKLTQMQENTEYTEQTDESQTFICGQCNVGFPDIEKCKQHMVQASQQTQVSQFRIRVTLSWFCQTCLISQAFWIFFSGS